MYFAERTGAARRADRLSQLAAALDQLNARIRIESGDVAIALALRSRFGPSLPSIQATQRAITAQMGRGVHSPEALARLHAALGELSGALTYPLAANIDAAPSRPTLRRAEQRADRLNASARDMLGAIAKAMAVGAAATALYASPAAAITCSGAPSIVCTGDLSAGELLFTSPPANSVTIKDLTKDITPPTGEFAVAFGAQGGDGGDGPIFTSGDNGDPGDSISLTVTDPTYKIVTENQLAIIFASTGGDGGNGGGAIVGHGGGNGGDGGNGGAIIGEIAIDISTTGDKAYGIVAISNGGGGGTGGDFLLGKAAAGNGGRGGAGGSVGLDFGPNSIVTDGKGADGIYAASLGGPGGHPGSCDVAICGTSGGGDSAVGGEVTVTTTVASLIHTKGGFSDGIYASSVGGFGGDGSTSYFSLGFASNGGSAGDGGQVGVENRGTIQTDSGVSDAIFAQSIGGGGGNGGASALSIVALGGGGAQGGNGGEVEVINDAAGHITTLGQYSRGIFTQSVGGGGGAGGAAIGLVSVGGNGSGTSDGGFVDVENHGSIVTKGAFSQDIFAQSIGGGGGDGGIAGGLVSIGGSGGGGGNGGKVEIVNKGAAITMADQSFAILGMSIGGGGGNGGIAGGGLVTIGGKGGDGGDGGDVSITNDGEVHTAGYHSKGIMAQSVGGGGGDGGDAAGAYAFINVSVGGAGGKGGAGGAVTITAGSASDILTVGSRSDGITAQSVGGGGGEGGYGASGAAGAFGAISVGVGGTGGEGGKGGTVDVTTDGSIVTEGINSRGIFAQSVGGGGGDGGFAVAAAAAGGPVAVSGAVAVGGSGGVGGASSEVTVDNMADISTSGDRSTAIYAQSVGGGGGAGGWSGAIGGAGGAVAGAISVSVGGFGKGGGDGAAVTIGNTGDIHTVGVDSFGIFAQSVGGGG
ncbi:MAG TPA: hypothetical protein VIJ94_09595, partial [Caulobacteraceae bacterium]